MYKTEQKKMLVDLFESNKNEIYSAQDIVDDFKDKMDKATVYRQLKSLSEGDYIRKIYSEEKKSYLYQYSKDCKNHLHLQCSKCGKIIHLSCSDADMFFGHILKKHGFSIDRYQTNIMGLCEECSKC